LRRHEERITRRKGKGIEPRYRIEAVNYQSRGRRSKRKDKIEIAKGLKGGGGNMDIARPNQKGGELKRQDKSCLIDEPFSGGGGKGACSETAVGFSGKIQTEL